MTKQEKIETLQELRHQLHTVAIYPTYTGGRCADAEYATRIDRLVAEIQDVLAMFRNTKRLRTKIENEMEKDKTKYCDNPDCFGDCPDCETGQKEAYAEIQSNINSLIEEYLRFGFGEDYAPSGAARESYYQRNS